MPDKVFLDTNIVLYLLSADRNKADRAEALIAAGGTISVQVLNEITAVAARKLRMPWNEIAEVIDTVRAVCPVEPLTIDAHDKGRALAERYSLSVYDAMIAGSALIADCTVLHSEDMQHGLLIEDRLTVNNPFHSASRA